MPSPNNTEPARQPVPEPLVLTWTFTETYRHRVALDAVAAATGAPAHELPVDPMMLLGVAGDRLADLLSDHQNPQRTVGVPEVEIIAADHDGSPTLAELVDAAHTALRVETEAGQPSAAGQALAALLAWLRREELTVR